MRALIVASFNPGTKGAYISTAFRRLGWETDFFDDWHYGFPGNIKISRLGQYLISRLPMLENSIIRAITDPLFKKKVRSYEPHLIFLSRSDRISASALKTVKIRTQASLVHWFPDGATHRSFFRILPSLPFLDILFLKDSYALDLLVGQGFNRLHFLPQCCSRDVHRRFRLSGKDKQFYGSDIAFTGTLTSGRLKLLDLLSGFDLKIWCAYPRLQLKSHSFLASRSMGHRAFGVEQTKVFNAAKIIVNLHRPTDVHGVNLRTFEAAGCGGFQITDRKSDLPLSFDEGTEIVCVDSVEEFPEIASYYLKHERERKRIANRAFRRAQAEHTYEHRIASILDHLDLPRESLKGV